MGAPAASELKMRIGASLRGLTAVGPWVQPLSVPWEAGGLAGLLCWAGWVGGAGTVAKERHARCPPHDLDHHWGLGGSPGTQQGSPFRPTAWTNVDDGPRQGRAEDFAPGGARGQLGMDWAPH